MGGLEIILIAFAFLIGLGIVGGIIASLHRRFPSQTKAILVLLVFAYAATMLVMCVNGDLRGPYRGEEYEPNCPGPPAATC